MRIALIAPFHDFGGSERQILLLLRGLEQKGIDFFFFHLNIRSRELVDSLDTIPGCKHVEIRFRSMKNLFFFAADVQKVAWQLRYHKCELAHCWNYTGHIIGGSASKLARIPCVFSFGGLDPWKKAWQLHFFRLLNRLVDDFVFQSDTEREIISRKEWIPLMRTRIIPNGIERQRFHIINHALDNQEVRKEFGLSPSIPLILSVGSLRPIKGHDVLIESVRKIYERRPGLPFHVIIVGDGHLRKVYEQSANELPISFAGFRADVERFYSAADLYCQPSRSEGLPNTVVEAMSCGLPVVASNVGAMAELVKADNGRLCQPEDSEDLAIQLCTLLENRAAWSSMANASIRASERFSAKSMVDSYVSGYCDMLAKQ